MRILFSLTLLTLSGFLFCCDRSSKLNLPAYESLPKSIPPASKHVKDSLLRTVHVLVALCDNTYQGIVPVGKTIGNGQDPDNNLYWGCEYGLRSFFKKKSSDWLLLASTKKPNSQVLEQLLFKHKTEQVFLLADAYDGKWIKQTTIDFLQSASGGHRIWKVYKNDTLYFGGASNLIAYIGHDGLMDFSLPMTKKSVDTTARETIILACYSKKFFSAHLKQTNAQPLIWTTGLMAPEAYTLHDALKLWAKGSSNEQIRETAADAYSKYQKCSMRAAKNLLVTGW